MDFDIAQAKELERAGELRREANEIFWNYFTVVFALSAGDRDILTNLFFLLGSPRYL